MNHKPKIAIIGGGSAALFFAVMIDGNKYQVDLFEKKSQVGRKFLVAGKGGFNLSFNESKDLMIPRYTPHEFMQPYITEADVDCFRFWLEKIGISTYVGSSNRVFPKVGTKPITVLNHLLKQIKIQNVSIHTDYRFSSFEENGLRFETENGSELISADYYIWSLGGASWSKTGSDGKWISSFEDFGIKTNDFQASNCAYEVNWPNSFIRNYEGQVLKNIKLSCKDYSKSGELVITKFGLEGNAIYALSPIIRNELKNESAIVILDLKPMWTEATILEKLNQSLLDNQRTQFLFTEIKLSKVQLKLLKAYTTKEVFLSNDLLAKAIKELQIEILSSAPIDEAISTVGGIDLNEIDLNFSLKSKPNHFCIGEMLDWDAPTGGYLLQACWSMSFWLSSYFNNK